MDKNFQWVSPPPCHHQQQKWWCLSPSRSVLRSLPTSFPSLILYLSLSPHLAHKMIPTLLHFPWISHQHHDGDDDNGDSSSSANMRQSYNGDFPCGTHVWKKNMPEKGPVLERANNVAFPHTLYISNFTLFWISQSVGIQMKYFLWWNAPSECFYLIFQGHIWTSWSFWGLEATLCSCVTVFLCVF